MDTGMDLPPSAPGRGPLGERPPRVPAGIEGAIGAVLMAALFLITFANVLVRYFTNVSFAFTEEYSVALMVVMAFAGSSAAFALDRQLKVGFFVDRLPMAARRAAEAAGLAIGAVFFGALAVYGGYYTWDEYRFEVLSPGLGVPQWQYTIALPVFSALIALRLLGRLVRVALSGQAR
jgi:TRAP-type C4-dicarboxylate transport system permease small subunit